MVNALINDTLGQAWGAVLARNATITSLVRRAATLPAREHPTPALAPRRLLTRS